MDDIGAVRNAALTALGAYDQPEALLFLLDRTSPDESPDAQPAVEGVGKWYKRNKDGKDFSLQKTIEKMDPPIGGELLYATAVADFPTVRPTALALLNAPAPRLRAAAIKTLRYFMDAELAPRLVDFLADDNAWVKCEAAIGCALLKVYDAIPKLIDMLEDPEPVVGQSAHIALKLLVGVPLPPKPDDWRAYLKNNPVKVVVPHIERK